MTVQTHQWFVQAKNVAYNSTEACIWKNKEGKGYKGNRNLNFAEPVFVWFQVTGTRMMHHQHI